MINYGLPKSVCIDGVEYPIRSDYRNILDIIEVLDDKELEEEERGVVALCIFYEDADTLPTEHLEEAMAECMKFINLGAEENGNSANQPKLVDWVKDIQFIIAPINKIAGCEVRALEYLHWWTFMSYYQEIGSDCMFSQIVQIRNKLATGKQLTKEDRKWYEQNRDIVDLNYYTKEDNELLEKWVKGG